MASNNNSCFFTPRFALGTVVATPGAIEALDQAGVNGGALVLRHVKGDWGDVPPPDAAMNEEAITNGSRIMSSYTLSTSVRIWIITEAGRHCTTLLLPDEY